MGYSMASRVLARAFAVSLISLSLVTQSIACTVLSYRDANGNMYTGRTNEYAGMQPDELTYFPAGTRIESVTPDGKQGHTFNTKYGIVGATLKGMVPNAKQDMLHEAVNDQGLTITANAFTENTQPKLTAPLDKILSVLDFGTWALGNFKNTQEVKQAIERKDIEVWLPNIASMWNLLAPVHYAMFDREGNGIVIEFNEGLINVYDNTVGVMTNDPSFPWHLKNLNNYAGLTNVDKSSGQFNRQKVMAPDSGSALRSLPASNLSPDRFIKAAYYSNFAWKAKTPDEAIQMVSHVMNNFDRPIGITIDEPGTGAKGEGAASKGPTSEATWFTTMNDLNQGHFYIRTIKMINYVKIDVRKLASLKAVKTVSFDVLSKHINLDGTDLFLK